MSGEVFVPAKPNVTIPYRINVKWLRYIEERYSGHEKPVEAFMEDVLSGRIRDENGLKLSPSQVEGRPPLGGFLQEVVGGSPDYERAKGDGTLGYRVGTVVKVCGNYDPELSQHHNRWGVITRIIDAYHYEVVLESDIYEKIVARDVDVKAIIADALHDYRGLGQERFRREVIPLIEKALADKIPYIPYPMTWPRKPLRQACVKARGYGSVEKAIRCMEYKLKRIEECNRRGLYYGDDYRFVKGMAVLWIKLFRMLKRIYDELRAGEGVVYTIGRKNLKEFADYLDFHGIPYVVKRNRRMKGFYDFIVCSELLEEVLKASTC